MDFTDHGGSILQDEATGVTHHLVPGDFAFFHVGSKVKVCHDTLIVQMLRAMN